FRPFHPRIGDRVSRDEPLVRGRESTLWELPMCFELDDWPLFQFNFDPPRHGLAAPSAVLEIWQGELSWMDANVDSGVLTVCMHPQVIGRAHGVAMLEGFVEHAEKLGARFQPLGDVAAALTWRSQRQAPASPTPAQGRRSRGLWAPSVRQPRPTPAALESRRACHRCRSR